MRHNIHYISWLFGILLTCTTLYSLNVPWHNVLKEPFYIYEIHVYFSPPYIIIVSAVYILRSVYWANITYAKNWTSFFILCGIGEINYIAFFLIYYYIWVHYLELFAPLPYGALIIGQLSILPLIFILFFRYLHTCHIRY